MYPKIFLDLFRDFDRTSEVFVAMSFADNFQPRWDTVFRPAIMSCGLIPYRVDVRTISDSILTDILAGIGRARLILVDTSFQQEPNRPAGPNANVMYELGVAHAMRLPEEVIVVRDEASRDPTPFDISHIRYTAFNPDDPEVARQTLTRLIEESLRAIDLTRDIVVTRTLRSLDLDAMSFLGTVGGCNIFDLFQFDPDRKGLYALGGRDSSEGELRDISRLLIALGILAPADPGPPEKRIYGGTEEYRVTPLGKAVWECLPDWCKNDGV